MKFKNQPVSPSIILPFGYPGAGKTTFSAKLADDISYAHINADKIIHQALSGKQLSNKDILSLLIYMTQEFLKTGVGVVFDADLSKRSERRLLAELARRNKLKVLTVWLQIDPHTAEFRCRSRDKRTSEAKYAKKYTKESFKTAAAALQNPTDEEHVVVSGKHTFKTQQSAVNKKLFDMKLMKTEELHKRVVKPELMSLVPKPTLGGEQRNISIN